METHVACSVDMPAEVHKARYGSESQMLWISFSVRELLLSYYPCIFSKPNYLELSESTGIMSTFSLFPVSAFPGMII